MRPHKFTLDEHHGFWIDLDSVIMIHDPVVPSRNDFYLSRYEVFELHRFHPVFSCSIVLAFQDKPKVIEWKDPEGIDHLLAEHEKLVNAWKN